jgi:HPt (histidine-containing phosphotransfer) domain-containing protein/two-component sensor histidine kinase
VKLWNYLFLPHEISAFERAYLRRMNRIALIFFYLHIPVFCGVAMLAGTSVLQAAIMTPIVLIGPTIVYFRFQNPRALAIAVGFTAMVLGGLLVHFGQGPMQIEMHFYFFVLLALLAVFGNPAAILTAAATVAVHHLVVWLVLPSSVFNYEASVWTVAVHALFVVLESVAAIFVARSFFDNVIGLEKIVSLRTVELDQRTRDMALVLENVGQGFVTISADGTMSAERSAILRTWLGEPPSSGKLVDYVSGVDSKFAGGLELGWTEVFAGIMPLELTLAQLPRRIEAAARHLQVDYRPIGGGDVPESVLVVVSDITAELERERVEAERHELMAVFERLSSDRDGLIEFCDEADGLIRRIDGDDGPPAELQRQLHTLKGNAAIFGVESVASYCHILETRMVEDPTPLTLDERRELGTRWRAFTSRLEAMLGQRDIRRIEITETDIQRVLAALRHDQPANALEMISGWRLEPTARRFERVAEQANRLARRMGKAVRVEIDDGGVRLDPRRWAPFWSTFVHAVRNAIDHGVEDAGERKQSGKPETARVELSSAVENGALTIEIRDDGRGVDWERVRGRAIKLGLPDGTHDELVEALFADGLSTKDEITDLSGRGVGLAALRAAASLEGGNLTLVSEARRGTCLRFRFPLARLAELELLPQRRSSQRLPSLTS